MLLAAAVWLGPAVAAEPVKITKVDVGLTEGGPVILLKARGRAIPIFVDPVVAKSVHSAITSEKTPRPLTHDLMRTVLESYGARVTRVGITLEGETFYGELTIARDGKETRFDSRSSDAIALALRFGAPIFVGEDLLESAGKRLPGTDEQEL
jgi:bifunctional DNase/RNase